MADDEETMSYVVPKRLRAKFLRMSSSNRVFFDHLCCLLWCECKDTTTTKSKHWSEWCDTLLYYYGTSKHAIIDKELGRSNVQTHTAQYYAFNTPRNVFTNAELDAIQAFINTHTFHTLVEAKQQIANDLFNDCVACGLNILQDRNT